MLENDANKKKDFSMQSVISCVLVFKSLVRITQIIRADQTCVCVRETARKYISAPDKSAQTQSPAHQQSVHILTSQTQHP